jgi:imidazolonepropionase-like amidohydrolase
MRLVVLFVIICMPYLSAQDGRAQEGLRTSQIVAIIGGRLVDVAKGTEVDNTVVLVAGDHIRAVGREGAIAIPPEAKVVDAHSKWLMPGLTDMHVHVGKTLFISPQLYLASGVTTVRDTGGDVTVLRFLDRNIRSGKTIGPRLYFAGQILNAPPPASMLVGIPTGILQGDLSGWILVDSEQRGVSAVNFLADQGASFIKVYNDISENVLIAVVTAAHARGLPVAGHIPRVMTMTRAIEIGMDCLEHIRITGRELLPKEEADKIDFLPLGRRETLLWRQFDPNSAAMKNLVNLITKRRVFLDPTLVVDEAAFRLTLEEVNSEPNNQILPPQALERLKAFVVPEFRAPAELKAEAAAGFEKRLRFIEMCHRAGVRLIAGTDGPGLGPTLPGFGLHHELELLVKAGLTPLDALRAATSTAADALRADKDLGAIEPGKLADLLILDADPLQNISNAQHIYRVMKGGEIYDPRELLANRGR